MYDVNLISIGNLNPRGDRATFDHDVAGTIHDSDLASDHACTEGDNALQAELTDGVPHHYHDLLTVTVEPALLSGPILL